MKYSIKTNKMSHPLENGYGKYLHLDYHYKKPEAKIPEVKTSKQKAKKMFDQLMEDDKLMSELNLLLRNEKIKQIKKSNG